MATIPSDDSGSTQRELEFRTRLLNMAAHELNTPLTPIRLQLHLLQSGALGMVPPQQEQAVDVLTRNVERLTALVKDILDVSRLEAGRLSLHMEPMRLLDVMDDAIETFQVSAERIGVRLERQTDTDHVVLADPMRVSQVLFNLIANGLKFTPAGGSILVGARPEGPDILVYVEDSGIGLDPAQAEELFEPFTRLHELAMKDVPGTGLGLYICKGIVEAHGGTIGVTSGGAGQGATFYFTLPSSTDRPTPRGRPARKDRKDLQTRLRELI